MSVLASQKVRGPKQHLFTVTVAIDGQDYSVTRLPIDPSIGSKAFRFHKHGPDDAVYDVYLSPYGWCCDCLGHTRHFHCKHAEIINRVCLLFGQPPALAVERVERVVLTPCSRCAGNGETEDGCGCDWCSGTGCEPTAAPAPVPAAAPAVDDADVPF